MYGSATLAIVVSSACINVAIIAQTVMMARCGTTPAGAVVVAVAADIAWSPAECR
jgi:hypothetical protein